MYYTYTHLHTGTVDNMPVLEGCGYAAVPLHQTTWEIAVRPQGWGLRFCKAPLAWKNVADKATISLTRECEVIGKEGEVPFRFGIITHSFTHTLLTCNIQRPDFVPV